MILESTNVYRMYCLNTPGRLQHTHVCMYVTDHSRASIRRRALESSAYLRIEGNMCVEEEEGGINGRLVVMVIVAVCACDMYA